MRLQLLYATCACFLATVPTFAQTVSPGTTTIILPDVEVRSGPSKTFFATSKLLRNDRVEILRESKEAQGWYEIKPPIGSFSWINSKYVKQMDAKTGVVVCDPASPVPVLPGSRLVNQAPQRESMKVGTGTGIVIVDRPMQVGGETWLPIEPHPHEVRYIPAEAVQAGKPVTPTIAGSSSWNLSPNGFVGDPKLAEADKAAAQGDRARALQLYQEVQANPANSQNERQLAATKIYNMNQTPASPFQTTSNVKPNETRTAMSPTPANLVQSDPPKWSAFGRLRETKLQSDLGQPLYTLEDDSGKTMAFVTNAPGKSLRDYVGRMVAVYGPTMYRPDSAVRMHYVVASHTALP